MKNNASDLIVRIAPGLFVLLWSTGFIGTKLGIPYAEPLTFLIWRFTLVLALLAPAALWLKRPWPASAAQAGHIAVAGMLVHAGYLGGVFCAIAQGVPAGIIALMVGLQPLLTAAAAARWLKETITGIQWLGFVLGLAGVVLVVADKATWQASATGIVFGAIALASITLGTLYQKKHCGAMDLITGSVIQFAASTAVLVPLALASETMAVTWSGRFVFALTWLIFVLSIGAISLLYLMLRLGEASRVSGLFYLTPVVTAVMAFFIFGERLGPLALAGMAAAAAGVALVMRR